MESDEARFRALQALPGFLPDGALDAAAADPARENLTVLIDDGFGTRLRGRRAVHSNDRSHGKRFSLGCQLVRVHKNVIRHR
jgi:hypothetical protein